MIWLISGENAGAKITDLLSGMHKIFFEPEKKKDLKVISLKGDRTTGKLLVMF